MVIAVIALLIGILLPSLKGARDAARTVVCQSALRQLATGGLTYCTDWKEYIAGVNTSGYEGQRVGGATYVGDRTPTTPTTSWDWISPTIGDSAGLSPNRAERTKQIFERFGCPAVSVSNTTLYEQTSAPDRSDFEGILRTRGYRSISFLAPGSFHRYPNQAAARSYNKDGFDPNYSSANQQNPVAVNPGYIPRLDLIGAQASNKVFAADGTRYLEFDGSSARPRL